MTAPLGNRIRAEVCAACYCGGVVGKSFDPVALALAVFSVLSKRCARQENLQRASDFSIFLSSGSNVFPSIAGGKAGKHDRLGPESIFLPRLIATNDSIENGS